jgi:hypothetical protein
MRYLFIRIERVKIYMKEVGSKMYIFTVLTNHYCGFTWKTEL